ncbi:MAG: hypothetical protein ACYTE0_06450 [Planctomycetota bacterium]|jgi:hypothetical protein
MRGLYYFVVKPIGSRYNNVKKIGDKSLITNTENFTHQNVNRSAIVLSVPLGIKTDVKPGDEVIVHHNVFRRWKDVRGVEQNSKSYFKEDQYFVQLDQMYLYKQNGVWKSIDDYCFVKPIYSNDIFSLDKETPCVGVLKYSNNSDELKQLKVGDLVGFTPRSEYEFIINGERLYRVLTKAMTIKYEYQGKEEEYNPSWV